MVPTVWDETRVLDGEVGKHIVVARRSGKDWFIGGMSGDEAYSFDSSARVSRPGQIQRRRSSLIPTIPEQTMRA